MAGLGLAVRPALAGDPAVPHRDTLLAPEAVAEVIAERLVRTGEPPTACERVRATYRVGDSLRVLHRVEIGGESLFIAARTFPSERLENALVRLVANAVPTDPLLPAVAVPELGALFWTFPNDRKLTSLRSLRATVGELLDTAPAKMSLVAYAPEKSAAV